MIPSFIILYRTCPQHKYKCHIIKFTYNVLQVRLLNMNDVSEEMNISVTYELFRAHLPTPVQMM